MKYFYMFSLLLIGSALQAMDPERREGTPQQDSLIYAIANPDPSRLEALLKKGAHKNFVPLDQSLFDIAIAHSTIEHLELLLKSSTPLEINRMKHEEDIRILYRSESPEVERRQARLDLVLNVKQALKYAKKQNRQASIFAGKSDQEIQEVPKEVPATLLPQENDPEEIPITVLSLEETEKLFGKNTKEQE